MTEVRARNEEMSSRWVKALRAAILLRQRILGNQINNLSTALETKVKF